MAGDHGSGFHIWIGGKINFEPGMMAYVGGQELHWNTEPGWMCMKELRSIIDSTGYEGDIFSIHYNRPHLSMSTGLSLVDTEDDVKAMVSHWQEDGVVNVYVEMREHDCEEQSSDGDFHVERKGMDENNDVFGGIKDGGNIVNSQEGLEKNDLEGLDGGAAINTEEARENIFEPFTGEIEVEEEEDYSDEEDLEDVGHASEDENSDIEYISRAKKYAIEVARRIAQKDCVGLGKANPFVNEDEHKKGDFGDSDFHNDSDVGWSLSEGSTESGSEGCSEGVGFLGVEAKRRRTRKTYFSFDNPRLMLGCIFLTRADFKEAVINDSVRRQVQIGYVKNDTRRVRFKCKSEGCPWMILASLVDDSTAEFKVKTYNPIHNCAKTFENKYCTSKYLAKRYMHLWRSAPNLKLIEFRKIVREQLNITIGKMKASRTKAMCRKKIEGEYMYQFSRLWSYAAEIDRSNPGSTIRIKHVTLDGEENPRFQRFYICFAALKQGFLSCCRPVIGLDGCFLKGVLKGQLLAVVGRDGNNQMYPIAWAVVEKENKDSWMWFLKLLKDDLDTSDGNGFALISDQQKGLKLAVEDLWPNSEHRFCARHIYANWRKKHPGKEMQIIFWMCAKSTTMADFNINIGRLDAQAQEDITRIHPSHWCKAFFKTITCCDIIDNNLTEAFNASIVEVRHMSIISMLESIRICCMRRIIKKQLQCQKWETSICPRIRVILEDNKDNSKFSMVLWWDENGFEVSERDEVFVVSTINSTCTCRAWDLQGIPCRHAITAMRTRNIDVHERVSDWYKTQLFSDLYSKHHLKQMVGDKFWPTSTMTPLTPPPFVKQTGRPKTKRMHTEGDGGTTTSYGQKGRKMRCKACFTVGHNSRSKNCPKKINKCADQSKGKHMGISINEPAAVDVGPYKGKAGAAVDVGPPKDKGKAGAAVDVGPPKDKGKAGVAVDVGPPKDKGKAGAAVDVGPPKDKGKAGAAVDVGTPKGNGKAGAAVDAKRKRGAAAQSNQFVGGQQHMGISINEPASGVTQAHSKITAKGKRTIGMRSPRKKWNNQPTTFNVQNSLSAALWKAQVLSATSSEMKKIKDNRNLPTQESKN